MSTDWARCFENPKEAASEIDALRSQVSELQRRLAEAQARERKLREALRTQKCAWDHSHQYAHLPDAQEDIASAFELANEYTDRALALPFDSAELDILLAEVRAKARREEKEICAIIAEQYGPGRPIIESRPSAVIVGRYEGEQAASRNIANIIRAGTEKKDSI